MSKPASFAVLTALLLTSAAPPPRVVAPVPPRPSDTSPVRCTVTPPPTSYYAPPVTRAPGKRDRSANDVREYLPSAPPPPPVPVPTLSKVPSSTGGVVVSGNYAGRPGPVGSPDNTERYDGRPVAPISRVAEAPVSTFSVDVDTASYANVRRFLNGGLLPPADAVRTEEMINYFRYDYPRPQDRAQPFSVTTDVARTPWNPNTRLIRVGLRGYDVSSAERPPANLVFLVDVSGSMNQPDKLPLVKSALTMLASQLRPQDKVAIVVYAGNAGVVLEPTSNQDYVKAALGCLQAGGSTAGGAGIKLAYDIARANFVKNGVNRIFLATDGDFNVGISDNKALEALVKANRDDGITLTTLGFGQGNYNDAMMERIADVGNGNYGYIDSAMEARKVLAEELSATMVTIARDVKIQVEFNPALVKEYRLIGYEDRILAEEDFNNDTVDAGDIGAGHQVTALYEVVPAGGTGWLEDRRYPGNKVTGTSTGREACFVKLRYKLPGENGSRLISRPVPGSLLASATAPRGDMAFITAVAAFGQKLRGDKYLGGYSLSDAGALAGSSDNYWRSEFVKLVEMARTEKPAT